MDNVADERKKAIAERKRLQHLNKYHNDEARRLYHIEYERARRANPVYREQRNARERELYRLRKQKLLDSNTLVNVN
jgi:hypothetical protein